MAADTSKQTLKAVGDYDLIEQLAEGGMGTVYKGRHRQSGELVAVKVVPTHLLNNQVLLKRFENEFRAASKLDHPNVVRALDYGTVAGRPYLVMEFVDGESLGQKLERDGKLSEEDAVRIIALAAQGLEQAHNQGLIHRDIKPDNIMVTKDGQVKIADLGLVKEMEADLNLTRTGRGLGTPHFMAPEQFRNAKNADVRCDIYSLGATMYQMVTGELPFKSCGPLDAWMKKMKNELTPARKLLPTLSKHIDATIQRSMSPEANHRQSSCQEFVDEMTGKVAPPAVPNADQAAEDLWYLVYKDGKGTTHTVKGSSAGIRREVKEGRLGDVANIRASRSKSGPFEALYKIEEFNEVVSTSDKVRDPVAQPNLNALRGSSPLAAQAAASTNSSLDSELQEISNESPQWVEAVKLILMAVGAMAIGMAVMYYTRK